MSFFRKLFFSASAVVLFFVLLEGILRLTYRPSAPFRFYPAHSQSVVERDPELAYRLRPNLKTSAYASLVETNSLGFRGGELKFQSWNDTGHRIVALGDSCTFGFGVTDNEHTYPAQLASLFRDRPGGESVEVINAGVVGYTSGQALKLLEKRIIGLRPDILLIYVGWNDLGNSLLADWTPTMTQDVAKRSSWANSPPYIVLALTDVLSPLRRRGKLGFKDEAIEVYADNLAGIVSLASQNGIKPMLLTWPTRVSRQIDELQNS